MNVASVQCISSGGLHRISYREWGEASNPRVLVCAHGLTRSGRDFDRLAAALSDTYRVICPDVAGRGLSDWLGNPNDYAVPQYVADMVTLIARLGVDSVDWFGTSMGGLIGMGLASLPNSPINKLLLNDVGPRLEPLALERIRDYLGKPELFDSEQEGVDHLAALAQSFGMLTPQQWYEINAPLLRLRQDGKWEYRYDPRIALSFNAVTPEVLAAGEAALWRAFEAIPGPILVARGAQSDLLSRETVAQMVARGRAVSAVEIEEAGHAPAFIDEAQIAIARRFFSYSSATRDE